MFEKSENLGEVFVYLWYNPWVLFIWFHVDYSDEESDTSETTNQKITTVKIIYDT